MRAKFGIVWIIYLNDPTFRPTIIISIINSIISIISLCQRQSTTWGKAGNKIKQEIKKYSNISTPNLVLVVFIVVFICHRNAPPPHISLHARSAAAAGVGPVFQNQFAINSA